MIGEVVKLCSLTSSYYNLDMVCGVVEVHPDMLEFCQTCGADEQRKEIDASSN